MLKLSYLAKYFILSCLLIACSTNGTSTNSVADAPKRNGYRLYKDMFLIEKKSFLFKTDDRFSLINIPTDTQRDVNQKIILPNEKAYRRAPQQFRHYHGWGDGKNRILAIIPRGTHFSLKQSLPKNVSFSSTIKIQLSDGFYKDTVVNFSDIGQIYFYKAAPMKKKAA
jgi:hypothetical protein